jgi:hypothetical protein
MVLILGNQCTAKDPADQDLQAALAALAASADLENSADQWADQWATSVTEVALADQWALVDQWALADQWARWAT